MDLFSGCTIDIYCSRFFSWLFLSVKKLPREAISQEAERQKREALFRSWDLDSSGTLDEQAGVCAIEDGCSKMWTQKTIELL